MGRPPKAQTVEVHAAVASPSASRKRKADELSSPAAAVTQAPAEVAPEAKRGRGRPPRADSLRGVVAEKSGRGRGRPRKEVSAPDGKGNGEQKGVKKSAPDDKARGRGRPKKAA